MKMKIQDPVNFELAINPGKRGELIADIALQIVEALI